MTPEPGKTEKRILPAASGAGRTIARDLTLGLTVVILSVSIVIVSLNYVILSRGTSVQLEEKADEYLANLLDSVQVPIWNFNEITVRKIAQAYTDNELVAKLRITDSRDRQIFDYAVTDAGNLIKKTGDVIYEGRIIGRVEIGMTSNPVKESNRDLLWSSILLALVTVLAVVGATGLLLRKFLKKPLELLLTGIDGIAKGEYDQGLPEAKQQEIQTIISRFNYMSRQVRSRESTLAGMNKQLKTEIADRKRVEAALQESESVLKATLESIDDGVLVVSATGFVSHYNFRFREIWSIPEETMSSHEDEKLIDYVLPQLLDPEGFMARTGEIYRTSQTTEDILRFKDGRILERFSYPMVREGGEGGRVWFFRDITERMRAEEALKESRSLLEESQRIAHVGSWSWDIETNEAFWTDEMYRILGRRPQEFQPKYAELVARVHPEDAECLPILKLKTLETYAEEEFECRVVRPDGTARWVYLTGRLFRDVDGKPVRMIGVMQDNTERKWAEKEIAKHQEHLEELVEERTRALEAAQEELLKRERLAVLGQLTATVSHELRNPLGVIRSSAFYLARKLSDAGEKTAKHLARIDEQVSICDAIVSDLLEYTRGRHSEKVTGEINPWLRQLLEDFTGLPNTRIVQRLAPDVPELSFDREKIRRVVVNLVTNAVQAVTAKEEQATSEGLVYHPEIRVSTERGEDCVHIRFEDNGIGMGAETAQRAFEPLFTTRPRGTGLGLAIVEKIVGEHGGTVSLDSHPEQGTRVLVTLPIASEP